MSTSQSLTIYALCMLVGFTLPTIKSWKWAIPQLLWVGFVGGCVSYSMHKLFRSDWYKGIESAVGFTLGF